MIDKTEKKYARAAHMANRYGIHRCTWWRWETEGKVPAPEIHTPSGDKLWNIEACDAHLRGGVSDG